MRELSKAVFKIRITTKYGHSVRPGSKQVLFVYIFSISYFGLIYSLDIILVNFSSSILNFMAAAIESKRDKEEHGFYLLHCVLNLLQLINVMISSFLLRFVPQGWIKAYTWSEADLEAACELVVRKNPRDSLKKFSDDWEADRGILDVAVYGGLLQDEYDMRMLQAILRQIWSKDMYTGRRKLGGALSVPQATSDNPIIMIDRLDDADSIQVYFGLPANAHRAWEKSAAELTLRYLNGECSSLLELQLNVKEGPD